MRFGEFLRLEFERAGIKKIKDMAEVAGVTGVYLGQAISHDRMLSDDVLVRIASRIYANDPHQDMKTCLLLATAAQERAKTHEAQEEWEKIKQRALAPGSKDLDNAVLAQGGGFIRGIALPVIGIVPAGVPMDLLRTGTPAENRDLVEAIQKEKVWRLRKP